jgi:hypothetical protein
MTLMQAKQSFVSDSGQRWIGPTTMMPLIQDAAQLMVIRL